MLFYISVFCFIFVAEVFKIHTFHCTWILPQKSAIKIYGKNFFCYSCRIYKSRKEKIVLCISYIKAFFPHLGGHHVAYLEITNSMYMSYIKHFIPISLGLIIFTNLESFLFFVLESSCF